MFWLFMKHIFKLKTRLVKIKLTLSAVEKTPYGKFSNGKSDPAGTSTKELIFEIFKFLLLPRSKANESKSAPTIKMISTVIKFKNVVLIQLTGRTKLTSNTKFLILIKPETLKTKQLFVCEVFTASTYFVVNNNKRVLLNICWNLLSSVQWHLYGSTKGI